MVADQGGAWGLSPPENVTGGLAMDPTPTKKTGFSHPPIVKEDIAHIHQ